MRTRQPCSGSSATRRSITVPSARVIPLSMTGLPPRSFLAAAGEMAAPMNVRGSLKAQLPQSRQAGRPSGPSARSRREFSHTKGARSFPVSSTLPEHTGHLPMVSPFGSAVLKGRASCSPTMRHTSCTTSATKGPAWDSLRAIAVRSRSMRAVRSTLRSSGTTSSMSARPSGVEVRVEPLRAR